MGARSKPATILDVTNGIYQGTSYGKLGGGINANNGNRVSITVNPADSTFYFRGNKTWTVEYWVKYNTTSTSTGDLFSIGNGTSMAGFLRIRTKIANPYAVIFGAESNELGGATLTNWTHHAFVCNGAGNISFYENGVLRDSSGAYDQYYSNNPYWWESNTTTRNIVLGCETTSLAIMFDEVRISDNVRYSSTFTPSSSAFVNDDNTLALYHFNGDTIDDIGSTPARSAVATVTNVGSTGNIDYTSSYKKYGTYSARSGGGAGGALDETLQIAVNPADSTFYFDSNQEWTVECWMTLDQYFSGGYTYTFLGVGGNSPSQEVRLGGTGVYANSLPIWVDGGSSQAAGSIALDTSGSRTFKHLAIVCDGAGKITTYVDGVRAGTNANYVSTVNNRNVWLGWNTNYAYTAYFYYDEFRVTKGQRYVTNFEVATSAFTDDANTLALLHFENSLVDDYVPPIKYGDAAITSAFTVSTDALKIKDTTASLTSSFEQLTLGDVTKDNIATLESSSSITTSANRIVEFNDVVDYTWDDANLSWDDLDWWERRGVIIDAQFSIYALIPIDFSSTLTASFDVTSQANKIAEAVSSMETSFTQSTLATRTKDIDLFAFTEAAIAAQVDRIRDTNTDATAYFDVATDYIRIKSSDSDIASVSDLFVIYERSRVFEIETQAAFSFEALLYGTKDVQSTCEVSSNLSIEYTKIISVESSISSQSTVEAVGYISANGYADLSSQTTLSATVTNIHGFDLVAFSNANITVDLIKINGGTADLSSAVSTSISADKVKLASADLAATTSVLIILGDKKYGDAAIASEFAQTVTADRFRSITDNLSSASTLTVSSLRTRDANSDLTTAFSVSSDVERYRGVDVNTTSSFEQNVIPAATLDFTSNTFVAVDLQCTISHIHGADLVAFGNASLDIIVNVTRENSSTVESISTLSSVININTDVISNNQITSTVNTVINPIRDYDANINSEFSSNINASKTTNTSASLLVEGFEVVIGVKETDIRCDAIIVSSVSVVPDIIRNVNVNILSVAFSEAHPVKITNVVSNNQLTSDLSSAPNRTRSFVIHTDAVASAMSIAYDIKQLLAVLSTTSTLSATGNIIVSRGAVLSVTANIVVNGNFRIFGSANIQSNFVANTNANKIAVGRATIDAAMSFVVAIRDLRIDDIIYKIPAEQRTFIIAGERRGFKIVSETRVRKIVQETSFRKIDGETRIHKIT